MPNPDAFLLSTRLKRGTVYLLGGAFWLSGCLPGVLAEAQATEQPEAFPSKGQRVYSALSKTHPVTTGQPKKKTLTTASKGSLPVASRLGNLNQLASSNPVSLKNPVSTPRSDRAKTAASATHSQSDGSSFILKPVKAPAPPEAAEPIKLAPFSGNRTTKPEEPKQHPSSLWNDPPPTEKQPEQQSLGQAAPKPEPNPAASDSAAATPTTFPSPSLAAAEKNNPAETDKNPPMEMVSLVNGGVTASLKEVAVKLDRPTLIGMVSRQNLDVRIAKTRVEQAKGVYFGSYGNLMPSVQGQLYVEKYDGGTIFIQATPVQVNRITYRPRLSFDYELPLGGKPLFQIRAAKFRVDSEDHSMEQAEQNALYKALVQYYEMIRTRMKKVITEQSLASMELLVKVNESKLKAGFGTRYEVEQARVQLAERQDELLEARNEATLSAIALASTLNLPVSSEFTSETDTLTPVRFIEPETNLTQFLAMADTHRPELKHLAAEIKAARAAYQASFSDLLPTFGITSYVGGVGQRTDALRPIFQRGISLDFDLLRNMGINTLGNLKTARSKLEQSIAEREKRVNEIHQKLATAYCDWQRYAQQIHVMKKKADAAEEAYRLAMARFKTGFGIQLEVLQAQTDYTNAIQDIQTSILNYNAAQLQLLLEAGRLTPETVLLAEDQPDFFSHPVLTGNNSLESALPTSEKPETKASNEAVSAH